MAPVVFVRIRGRTSGVLAAVQTTRPTIAHVMNAYVLATYRTDRDAGDARRQLERAGHVCSSDIECSRCVKREPPPPRRDAEPERPANGRAEPERPANGRAEPERPAKRARGDPPPPPNQTEPTFAQRLREMCGSMVAAHIQRRVEPWLRRKVCSECDVVYVLTQLGAPRRRTGPNAARDAIERLSDRAAFTVFDDYAEGKLYVFAERTQDVAQRLQRAVESDDFARVCGQFDWAARRELRMFPKQQPKIA